MCIQKDIYPASHLSKVACRHLFYMSSLARERAVSNSKPTGRQVSRAPNADGLAHQRDSGCLVKHYSDWSCSETGIPDTRQQPLTAPYYHGDLPETIIFGTLRDVGFHLCKISTSWGQEMSLLPTSDSLSMEPDIAAAATRSGGLARFAVSRPLEPGVK